jgi:expansin (peptidoglycan-binding protein)
MGTRILRISVVGLMALGGSLFGVSCGGDATTGGAASGGGAPQMDLSCKNDTDMHGGDGTYYDATGAGNCGFDATPDDLMVGAMNHVDYAASAVCGACVHMSHPGGGEATVRIVDQCPECNQGDIDLSMLAFGKLADPSLGRIHIDWTYVPCQVTGPIVYHFKDGANAYWTAIQIRNSVYAIAKFEVQKNGSFVSVDRLDYNYFVDASGMGPGPYTFRVTDVKGHVLTDSNVPLLNDADSPGKAQFPECAGM